MDHVRHLLEPGPGLLGDLARARRGDDLRDRRQAPLRGGGKNHHRQRPRRRHVARADRLEGSVRQDHGRDRPRPPGRRHGGCRRRPPGRPQQRLLHRTDSADRYARRQLRLARGDLWSGRLRQGVWRRGRRDPHGQRQPLRSCSRRHVGRQGPLRARRPRFRAGIVWINCSQPTFTEAPWGGYKQSGIGRELGRWGLSNYLETKQITSFDADEPWGWYIKG